MASQISRTRRKSAKDARGRRDLQDGLNPVSSLPAIEQVVKGLERVNLLMDACDAWLRDADDPLRYDIGPREGEVTVTYEVERESARGAVTRVKRRKPLSALLAELEAVDGERVCAVKSWESKQGDPRELILRTAREARETVKAAADLARMFADMRAMEVFRDSLLAEIAKVSPEVASKIADAVRRSIVLGGAVDGDGALPP